MIPIRLSVAMSVDGYLNDTSDRRLILSSPEDLADVQRERANCEAILVGAETVRTDNPSLVLRAPELMAKRLRIGLPEQLTKVTVTATGNLDRGARFFTEGNGRKIVLCPKRTMRSVKGKFGGAVAIGIDEPMTATAIASALERAAVRSLFVEGGARTLSMFLSEATFSSFRLAIAPVFVAENGSPRLNFAFGAEYISRFLKLKRVRRLGDTFVMDYNRDSRTSPLEIL